MNEIETLEVVDDTPKTHKVAGAAFLGLALVGVFVVAKKTAELTVEFVQKVHPTD